jgi:RNA polymerase sigma factor (sigma-70 family)
MNDWQLLQQYVTRGSEAAFSAVVANHVNLVYSTAARQVRDPQLAEEVTQAVFILMARKAPSFPQHVVLPGWLYRTARFVGSSAARAEQRRRRREQEALLMQNDSASEESWRGLSAVLDEALEQLREGDRHALILRFLQERPLQDVGAMLGITEEAARKRVDRSLKKLRIIFARRGFTVSAVGLATTLGRHGAEAAPVGLREAMTPHVMAHQAAAVPSLPRLVQDALSAWRRIRAIRTLGIGTLAGFACLLIMGGAHHAPKAVPAAVEVVSAIAPAQEQAAVPDSAQPRPAGDKTEALSGLRVQGYTEYRFFGFSDSRLISESHTAFTLDLDRSGRWLMAARAGFNTNACLVMGFDGANNYGVTYSSCKSIYPGSAELTEDIPYEKGVHNATISQGAYPFDSCTWGNQRLIWFALASGSYLSQADAGRMPAPWRDARTDMLAYSFTNAIEMSAAWPTVPVAAQFVTCPSLAQRDLPDLVVPENIRVMRLDPAEGKTVLVALSSNFSGPFPRGEDYGLSAPPIQANSIDPGLLAVAMKNIPMRFMTGEEQGLKIPPLRPRRLAARYGVEQWTNFCSLLVPRHFKLEVFWPGFGVNTTNQSVASLEIGMITNVSAIASTTGRPEINGELSVADYRQNPAGSRNPERYHIWDHTWR